MDGLADEWDCSACCEIPKESVKELWFFVVVVVLKEQLRKHGSYGLSDLSKQPHLVTGGLGFFRSFILQSSF